MGKEFVNCLRVQICPGHYEQQRIESIANFCLKYGFQNVMLFVNSEEYNLGHITIEEVKPWIETIKKAKKYFEELGLTVSLNPWMELGHLDRGRKLKDGQNFTTMMDYNGKQCSLVVCPLCENWQNYFLELYSYMLAEIQPHTVWVEDDFRLHNHGDLEYGGCFCKLHMQKYNEKAGTNYTREEFRDRLFGSKAQLRIRKAWLDVNRECMRSLAQKIGQTVSESGANIRVGLMSSTHPSHELEGRDWYGIHKGLSPSAPLFDRLHLPCYEEFSAKRYYFLFNQYSYACRAFLPKNAIVYPEIECEVFGTYAKDASFMRFQIESAIPLCMEGMTYDIFDFVGNGAIESYGYGKKIKEIMPYLNGVLRLNLQYSSAEGMILPIDEKTAYHRNTKITCFNDLYPDESCFGAYFASIGINTKVSLKKKYKNKIVALAGGNVYNFTNEQLRTLFDDNYVILEGGAAEALIERGLGELICAKEYKELPSAENYYSFEQVSGERIIHGVHGYRADADRAGNYVKIDYLAGTEKSFLCNAMGQRVGTGIMTKGKFLVIPFHLNRIYSEQYNDLRTTIIKDWIKEKNVSLIFTNYPGIYAYLFRQKSRDVLVVVNSTEEDFESTNLEFINITCAKIKKIDRITGEILPVDYFVEQGMVKIQEKNSHLSTQTFLLYKNGD